MTDAFEDIEADFIAIYHMRVDGCESGAEFVKLASRLIYFQGGCIRGKAEAEANKRESNSNSRKTYNQDPDGRFQPGESMSMAEAVSRSKGQSSNGKLDTMNSQSRQAGKGDLFEVTTA